MALLSYYDIGFASVANGSTAVTGTSTQWLTALRENDVFVGADGRTARIASIESATSMTLARAWPGDSQTSDVYEVRITPAPSEITASVRELLEKLRQGLWLTPNATGTLAERAGYDSARRGFIYMQTDVDPFVVFVKQTDTAGDWSPGFSPQQGPAGPYTTIEAGTVTTLAPDAPATVSEVAVGGVTTLNFGIPAGEGFYFKGTYSAAVTYSKDDVVFYNGSAFIANVTTQANTPDPTQNTGAWSRLALRGNDGDITGVTPFWAGRIQVDADAAAARTGLNAMRDLLYTPGGAPLDSGFNDITSPGPAPRLARSASGGPFASEAPTLDDYYYVLVFEFGSNLTQVAFSYLGGSGRNCYFRARQGGVWSAWASLTNSATLITNGTLPDARISAALTPDKAYRRGNVLGTVSQSGGVPTGAIIERETNANGTYTRYADGTQICVSGNIGTRDTQVANGNLFISNNNDTWTFPAVFSSVPIVAGNGGGVTRWLSCAAPSVSSVLVRLMGTSASTSVTDQTATAIGRWF